MGDGFSLAMPNRLRGLVILPIAAILIALDVKLRRHDPHDR